MTKDNLKITISFPSLDKKIKTNTDTIQEAAKILKKRRKCKHKKTVAINEEGHAGVFCSGCGEQLEKEC